ncbi:MAG: alanine--tRNA ligase [Pseudomonadales bacterium]|nr:alanine--tRNA ligase [Pseudomonadales bacterium]
MNSSALRAAFLEYFSSKGHQTVSSSSLVPGNDPTLLFTNAGMVQFKDVFLGQDQRPYQRATSSQRCVRAGGKHNDLENVGYTARHHTFFEMLGNFSFGDYFKREAIQYAWQFLTETLGLPEDKLWVTVYNEDQEAEDIWLKEMGVSAERFSRLGEKDNFWSMGDTGPCGPCSEIFYDHGADVPGGPPGSPDEDGDRYIEIWNLVFMQFDRDASGTLKPLPKPSVDTGMGLERIAAVMQGVHNNYQIDLFQGLLKAAAELTGCKDPEHDSLKVIADHIRSCAFLVVDGIVPSNEGRGYVLRRIIRRALRHGYKLGKNDPFFHKLVAPLVAEMGEAYPELLEAQARVEKILLGEEQQFARTLDQGMKIFEQDLESLEGKTIPGNLLFKLYDTYGFPVDLTADIARERGLTVDQDGFEIAMEEQRNRARSASQFGHAGVQGIGFVGETTFKGYESLKEEVTVESLVVDSAFAEMVSVGQKCDVHLNVSPFYAESGGQVGDAGRLFNDSVEFKVITTHGAGGVFLHHGELIRGELKKGVHLTAEVDTARRHAIELNHSATHLLHAALRNELGNHVTQKGSLVDGERLRFDFSHFEAVTPEQLKTIEQAVNQQIQLNSAVSTDILDPEAAKEKGAMALFGEKYGDKVRVLSMGGDYSIELCGGTHVTRTGDIGLIRIVSEGGIAAGVRRIEAVTGNQALAYLDGQQSQLEEIGRLVRAGSDRIEGRVASLVADNKQNEKTIQQLKAKLAAFEGGNLVDEAKEIGGIKVLAAKLDGADPKSLRDTLDQLRNKLGSSIVVLGTSSGEKVSLIAGVSKDLTKQVKAGDLVNYVAQQVGGKGGGRPDMAQAGGSQPENLQAAVDSVYAWVDDQL